MVHHSSYTALLGAGLSIVSLAVGPSTQQGLKTFVCSAPVESGPDTATVSIAQRASKDPTFAFHDALFKINITGSMKAAIIGGLRNTGSTSSPVRFHCVTGNCTFDESTVDEYNNITYSSVGYCSTCRDLTNSIIEITDDVDKDWFNSDQSRVPDRAPYLRGPSYRLFNQTITSWASGTSPWLTLRIDPSATVHRSLEITVLSFTHATCSTIENPEASYRNLPYRPFNCTRNTSSDPVVLNGTMQIVGAGCSIFPCLRHYHGLVVNGSLQESIVSTVPVDLDHWGWVRLAPFVPLYAVKSPCHVDKRSYNQQNFKGVSNFSIHQGIPNFIAPEECIYGIPGELHAALYSFFYDSLNGTCDGTQRDYLDESNLSQVVICPYELWHLEALYNEGAATFNSISEAFANLTISITNQMRNSGLNSWGNVSSVALGVASKSTVCTNFDWVWMSLPIALIASTTLLLASVLLKSWKDRGIRPIWKSSMYPLLFNAADKGLKNNELLGNLDNMESTARRTRARLGKGNLELVVVRNQSKLNLKLQRTGSEMGDFELHGLDQCT